MHINKPKHGHSLAKIHKNADMCLTKTCIRAEVYTIVLSLVGLPTLALEIPGDMGEKHRTGRVLGGERVEQG